MKMTLMLIVISFIYIFGNIPHLVSYMIRLATNKRVEWLARFSQCTLYSLVTFKLFVYYGFNSEFKQTVNKFLKKLFFINCRRGDSDPFLAESKSSTEKRTSKVETQI
jgi:hypothetical protein